MVVGQFGSFIHGLMKNYTKPIEDGDIILLSDPYSCEGAMSHANDWLVVLPIFHGGSRLVSRAAYHSSTEAAQISLDPPLMEPHNTTLTALGLAVTRLDRWAGRPCSVT